MKNKIIYILIVVVLFFIPSSTATTGLIAFSPTEYNLTDYGHVLVSLSGGDFGSYTYFIENRNPNDTQTETGQIFSDGSWSNTADLPFDVSGIWTANIFSCGYGDCVNQKTILDNATATVFGGMPEQLSVQFSAIGYGQMYVFKNSDLVGLATPGNSVTIGYSIGDSIGFVAYPYINAYLVSICDIPYTECSSDASHSYQVTGTGNIQMVATFLKKQTNMPVKFHVEGNGQVYIFKNYDLVGLATKSTSTNGTGNVTILYNYGDQLGWEAYPYYNESFISVCDVPFTECSNLSYGNFDIIGNMSPLFIFTFSTNISSGFESQHILEPNGFYQIGVGNETVGTIVDKINASALGYTVFGCLIFIIRFFSIKTGE